MFRWVLAIVAILLPLLPASLFADGLIIIERPPHIIPGHFPFAPLEIGYHRVDVKIDAQVAVTTVDQEFINPGSVRLEGTYLFPLPAGAHIDKFAMDIDGQMAEAELLSADKARHIYEDIVRRHRDPALLEYVGHDAFKVRVFPIEPHSHKHIKIRYTQVLKSDGGLVEYVYPLNTEKFSSKLIRDVSVKVELDSKHPLKSVYCPSHNAEVKRDGDHRAVIGWEQHDVRPDTDFKLVFSTGTEAVGMDLLSYREDRDGDGFFMLLASPGAQRTNSPSPKDICFVLDTSGSMAQNGKLEQAKKAMEFCLANLNDRDRFQLIRFSTESEPLFDNLEAADPGNISKAREFVRSLKPIGGTAIGDALAQAIKARTDHDSARPYVIVFITDGLPTVGETDEDRLVARATHGPRTAPRIFTFGVGTDVNTHLLDRIAQETRGSSQYVLPNEDLEVKLSTFYTKIKEPALTDLKLEISGITLQQVYPKELPDLFYGEQLIVLGKYKGGDRESLKTAVKLSGMMDGREIVIVDDVELPARDTRHEFIPRLWATRRVGWLLDEIRLNGESHELKDEVTHLARRYGIVTPYTAYLILEDEDRRHVPIELRSMRQIEENRALRDSAGDFYFSNKAEAADATLRSGGRAVTNAQRLGEMKGGWNMEQSVQTMPSAVAGAGGGMRGGMGAAGPSQQGYRMQQSTAGQNMRVVNNRAFYQNGNVWVDSTAQTRKDLKQQQIKLGSDEYFAFVSSNRAAVPWLSLGTEVDVVIGDTLYQIR